jgi:hypothetical protein
MSGLFQRIARRGAEPLDGTGTTATGEAPDPGGPEATDAADPPTDAPTQQLPMLEPAAEAVAAPVAEQDTPATAPPAQRPGFRERGRIRRRARYLRKLRELQVRDLGGLVFDLRRFERRRDDLVAQKVDQIRACDDELRALEAASDDRRELRDVREPGIGGTCPRCFALYGSTDRFCCTCGAALGGAVQGPAQILPHTTVAPSPTAAAPPAAAAAAPPAPAAAAPPAPAAAAPPAPADEPPQP